MHLQTENGYLALKKFEHRLCQTLRELQKGLFLSDSRFAGKLGISATDYLKYRRGEFRLPLSSLYEFCREFELDFELVFSGELDVPVFLAQRQPQDLVLRQKYQIPEQRLSRLRSLGQVYSALVSLWGEDRAKALFRKFQIPSEILTTATQSEAFVSPELTVDLFRELRRLGFSDKQFRWLGLAGILSTLESNPVVKRLSHFSAPQALYRAMHEEMMWMFDQVWSYELVQLTPSHCRVRVATPEKTQTIFKTKAVGSRDLSLARQGVYSGLLCALGLPPAKIEEHSCEYSGAPVSEFSLFW